MTCLHARPSLLRIIPCLITAVCLMPEPALSQLVVAHRGASYDAPENTLSAFRLAWQQGADAIEGDFRLTFDKQIICLHDKSTKRVAGVDLEAAETELKYLQRLDVGRWKGRRWQGERIATLNQVLATVPAGKKIFIELKAGPPIVPALLQVLQSADLESELVVVIAFDSRTVAAVRKALPELKVNWLVGFQQDRQSGAWEPSREQVLRTLKQCNATGLGCQAERKVVDRAFAGALTDAGYELHIWTVNKPEDARYFASLGVDSITTDRPTLIRKSLQRR